MYTHIQNLDLLKFKDIHKKIILKESWKELKFGSWKQCKNNYKNRERGSGYKTNRKNGY